MARFLLKTKLPLPEAQMQAITAETAKRIDKVALKVQQKYRGKVRSFSTKTRPSFKRQTEVGGGHSIKSEVVAREKRVRKQVFRWLLRGVKPHIIKARKGPFMRFQVGTYSPKRFGGSGGPSNPRWITVKQVNHPGIKPWGIEEQFKKESIPELREAINDGISAGFRKQVSNV